MGSAGFEVRPWEWLTHLLSPFSYRSPYKNTQRIPKPGQTQEQLQNQEAIIEASSDTQDSPLAISQEVQERKTTMLLSAKAHTVILSMLKQFQRKDQKKLKPTKPRTSLKVALK